MNELNEIVKPIDDFNGYYVSNLGNVYSDKNGDLKLLKPWLDSKGRYLMVSLSQDGKKNNRLVHRLVAQAFLPNPNNLPVVNHKDKNTHNPCVNNLEWCTTKYNVHDSYSTMSQNRNFRKCLLYKDNKLIGEFDGIRKASQYAQDVYRASKSALEKYRSYNDITVVPVDKNSGSDGVKRKTNRCLEIRSPIHVYKNNVDVATFATFREIANYFTNELGIPSNDRKLNWYYHNNKDYYGYSFKRLSN